MQFLPGGVFGNGDLFSGYFIFLSCFGKWRIRTLYRLEPSYLARSSDFRWFLLGAQTLFTIVFEKYGTLPYLTRLIPYGKLRKLH